MLLLEEVGARGVVGADNQQSRGWIESWGTIVRPARFIGRDQAVARRMLVRIGIGRPRAGSKLRISTSGALYPRWSTTTPIKLDAFKRTEQFKRNERVAGSTPLQRFFLAFAYGNAAHERLSGHFLPQQGEFL